MWSSAALLLEYDRNNWFTKTLAYMFMLKTTAVFGGIFSSLKEYVSAGSHPLQHTGGLYFHILPEAKVTWGHLYV